ncbi:MAG: hypothetical protein M1818_001605 [Claussenomyces sp. TS43310]|nr:MAG: hypothetical protein M1818_001605 [Claussenomyces sp. TS43310]
MADPQLHTGDKAEAVDKIAAGAEAAPPSPSPSPSKRTSHKANCHCGAVRYTVTLDRPFPEYKINRCSCSICTKNGYLLVYPKRSDVVWHRGYENLSDYYFGEKTKAHKFCKTCSSSVLIDWRRSELGEKDPEKDVLAVNTRLFADIDFDKMEFITFDGKNRLYPPYSVED